MTRITSRYTGSIQSTEVDGCVITHRQLETKWCGERSRARERKDHFSLFPKPNCHFHYRPTYCISLQLFSTAAAANTNATTTTDADAREGEIITKQVNDEHEENERLLLFFLQIKGGREGQLKVLADSKIKVNEPKETHWTSSIQFWVPSGQPTANLTM